MVSDKKEENYKKVLNHLEIHPSEFLMIGNSLKSDVLPLIHINANAIHIPFHTTWQHEEAQVNTEMSKKYLTLKSINELLELLD